MHDFHDAIAIHLQVLLHNEGFLNGDLDNTAFLCGDNTVAAAFNKRVDCIIAHARCRLAVTGIGCATALNMAQYSNTRIHANGVMDFFAYFHSAAYPFGHNDHKVCVSGKAGILNTFYDVFLKIGRSFRNQYGCSTDSYADIQRQKACIAAHDFNDRAPLMRLHRVSQTVNTFDCRIAGSIKTDRIIRAAHVIVNRCGNAYDRNTQSREFKRSAEGPVAADGDNAVETEHLTRGYSLQTTGFAHKLLAAGGIENRSAPGENVTDAFTGKGNEIAVNQALPAATDTYALDSVSNRSTYHGANSGIHAGSIASAGQYTDAFDFFIHVQALQINLGMVNTMFKKQFNR